jgi:ubiquinone/menaquinone biosynthesis C-methylase UbiE
MTDAACISGEQGLQTETLEELSAAVNYRSALVKLGLPWLGSHAIEIGSGNGDYASTWAAAGQRLTATEVQSARLAQLHQRFDHNPLVDVEKLRLPSEHAGGFSAAVAYNVLEHIDDDVAALKSMRGLVRVGGHVVILVPAFQIGMSEFDRKIGHYRRYRTKTTTEKLRQAGLEPVLVRYVNFVGLPLWVVLVRGLRRTPRNTVALRLYDRFMVPLVAALEERVRLPFGQSVFAVGKRVTE